RNHALNLIKQQGARQKLSSRLEQEYDHQAITGQGEVDYSETNMSGLINQIWKLVEKMPEQRNMVFMLHRKHGLSYTEISEVMGIARKTVENHMGKALQELREKLDINLKPIPEDTLP
ncbi:MAG: sigma-70 family RNA polymerase sigma factor, partial [Balneolales bacterium]